jgi:hypothetical protein
MSNKEESLENIVNFDLLERKGGTERERGKRDLGFYI